MVDLMTVYKIEVTTLVSERDREGLKRGGITQLSGPGD